MAWLERLAGADVAREAADGVTPIAVSLEALNSRLARVESMLVDLLVLVAQQDADDDPAPPQKTLDGVREGAPRDQSLEL